MCNLKLVAFLPHSDHCRGRYGIVYKCVDKTTGRRLAAKYVRLRSKKKPEIRREAELLRLLQGGSPHVVQFCDSFERNRHLIIIMEM